jgi:hypothetical protein
MKRDTGEGTKQNVRTGAGNIRTVDMTFGRNVNRQRSDWQGRAHAYKRDNVTHLVRSVHLKRLRLNNSLLGTTPVSFVLVKENYNQIPSPNV